MFYWLLFWSKKKLQVNVSTTKQYIFEFNSAQKLNELWNIK